MSSITIHSEKNITYTNVPDFFIDDYIADANGEFVKVYLYLLRCLHAPVRKLSISYMADVLNHTEKDIRRALRYWEKMGLLGLEYDSSNELSGICFLSPGKSNTDVFATSKASIPEYIPPMATSGNIIKADTMRRDYSADEISNFKRDEKVSELFYIAETYLRRTLSASDCQTLLYLYDGLHFSTELEEYLIEYCVSKGHTSIRYIEKTGIAWSQKGIKNVADAKAQNRNHQKSHNAVIKAFGIRGRDLVDSEKGFVDKWNRNYGFSPELIIEACNRTMRTIHQPSFEYTDKILQNWKENKITSLSELTTLDNCYQQKNKSALSASRNMRQTSDFNQRSYDYAQLEKQLVGTRPHND